MQKYFHSVRSFINLRDDCLFCKVHLVANITNFTGIKNDEWPIFNSPLKSDQFNIVINHTTSSYDIKANANINIDTGEVIFEFPNHSLMPNVDQYMSRGALADLKPCIELTCPNKKCKYNYCISSYILDVHNIAHENQITPKWKVSQVRLFLEDFEIKNHFIQNDWIREETHIFSDDSETPIIIPIIDFADIEEESLLSRISTYITFN